MTSTCTIVMYHYVRSLAGSRIKGLDVAQFDEQLDYIQRHYTVISVEQLLEALDAGDGMPPKSALLTFDDGFIDHYCNVFPRLQAKRMTGAFFPPEAVVVNRSLLDVHKLHHVLASHASPDDLVKVIESICQERSGDLGLDRISVYREKYWVANRFDPPSVNYVKRMLQHGLPERLRVEIVQLLFGRYVTKDELDFAECLYLSMDQLREMVDAGMHVGSHGVRHSWLSRLDRNGQEEEIRGSLDFLRDLGCNSNNYTICYPYGDYDPVTLDLVAAAGIKAGFTTRPALADLRASGRFTLARLDTNDLPKRADAPANEWTQRAGQNEIRLDGSAA